MDITNNTTLIIVVAVAILIVVALIGMALSRTWRSERLRERFGSEYEKTVSELGDKRQAESELEKRIAHVKDLQIRPLTAEEVNRYALEWQETQRDFVDEPLKSLQKADRLIREAMKAKGYPVEDFEQRAADLSVDYPELVTNYRGMHLTALKQEHDPASTEEMRQAMVHGRALFESLIKQDPKEEDIKQKEKI